MIIDNEFKGLIPPLTDEEYKRLEGTRMWKCRLGKK